MREEPIKEWFDSENRTKREIRRFIIQQLRVMKKEFSYGKNHNIDNNTWSGKLVNKTKVTKIGLAIELAEAVYTTDRAIRKVISSKSNLTKLLLFIPAFVLAVPYFLVMVTYNFFASRANKNVEFNRALLAGELSLGNAVLHQTAAILRINREVGPINRIKDVWFTLKLYAPITAGIVEFAIARVGLALITWYFSGPLAAAALNIYPELATNCSLLTGLFSIFGSVFSIFGCSGVEEFLIKNIQPSWSNLLRLYLLNLGLSAFSSVRLIFNSLRKGEAEVILSKVNLDQTKDDSELARFYKSGLIYSARNPELLELFRVRFGKRNKFKLLANYSWRIPLAVATYVVNTILPVAFIANLAISEENKRVKAFVNGLGALKISFWSGYITLSVIGAEIQMVVGTADHIGGPIATIANAWEGPNGIIGIGGDIVGIGQNSIEWSVGKIIGKDVKVNIPQSIYSFLGGKGDLSIVQIMEQMISSGDMEKTLLSGITPEIMKAQGKDKFDMYYKMAQIYYMVNSQKSIPGTTEEMLFPLGAMPTRDSAEPKKGKTHKSEKDQAYFDKPVPEGLLENYTILKMIPDISKFDTEVSQAVRFLSRSDKRSRAPPVVKANIIDTRKKFSFGATVIDNVLYIENAFFKEILKGKYSLARVVVHEFNGRSHTLNRLAEYNYLVYRTYHNATVYAKLGLDFIKDLKPRLNKELFAAGFYLLASLPPFTLVVPDKSWGAEPTTYEEQMLSKKDFEAANAKLGELNNIASDDANINRGLPSQLEPVIAERKKQLSRKSHPYNT